MPQNLITESFYFQSKPFYQTLTKIELAEEDTLDEKSIKPIIDSALQLLQVKGKSDKKIFPNNISPLAIFDNAFFMTNNNFPREGYMIAYQPNDDYNYDLSMLNIPMQYRVVFMTTENCILPISWIFGLRDKKLFDGCIMAFHYIMRIYCSPDLDYEHEMFSEWVYNEMDDKETHLTTEQFRQTKKWHLASKKYPSGRFQKTLISIDSSPKDLLYDKSIAKFTIEQTMEFLNKTVRKKNAEIKQVISHLIQMMKLLRYEKHNLNVYCSAFDFDLNDGTPAMGYDYAQLIFDPNDLFSEHILTDIQMRENEVGGFGYSYNATIYENPSNSYFDSGFLEEFLTLIPNVQNSIYEYYGKHISGPNGCFKWF